MAEDLKIEEGKEGNNERKRKEGKGRKERWQDEGKAGGTEVKIIPNSSFYKEPTLRTAFDLQ